MGIPFSWTRSAAGDTSPGSTAVSRRGRAWWARSGLDLSAHCSFLPCWPVMSAGVGVGLTVVSSGPSTEVHGTVLRGFIGLNRETVPRRRVFTSADLGFRFREFRPRSSGRVLGCCISWNVYVLILWMYRSVSCIGWKKKKKNNIQFKPKSVRPYLSFLSRKLIRYSFWHLPVCAA